MKKIGAITLNWNGEQFIYPHLKMLTQGGVDSHVVIQGNRPWSGYGAEYKLSSQPDRSEAIVRKYFPEVDIIPAVEDEFGATVYNQGLDYLKNCDVVLRLDFDMFMTPKDWNKLIEFIRTSDHDCYLLDFARNTVNYYYDFNHGSRNAKEFDPIAVSPKKHFSELLNYPDSNSVIMSAQNNFDGIIHHFRGWKGFGRDASWIENLKANHNGVFADQVKQEDPDGEWQSCPKEICDMLVESEEALANL